MKGGTMLEQRRWKARSSKHSISVLDLVTLALSRPIDRLRRGSAWPFTSGRPEYRSATRAGSCSAWSMASTPRGGAPGASPGPSCLWTAPWRPSTASPRALPASAPRRVPTTPASPSSWRRRLAAWCRGRSWSTWNQRLSVRPRL